MTSARRRACLSLVLGFMMLIGIAGPALASDSLVLAQEEPSGTSFRGELVDADDNPVVGAVITVTAADGSEVETIETGEDGTWEVPVPAAGEYNVELDESSLPEGVELRNPDVNPFTITLRDGQTRTIIFATGEGVAKVSFLSRFIQQTFNGLRFGLVIAITAIGLSLIFGTTGLVNFAHGELVTVGAAVAWFFNSPGHLGGKVWLPIAAVLAIVFTGGVGAALEGGLWRPLRRRRTGLIQMLVISIGLSLLLRNLIQLVFGGRRLPYFDYTIGRSVSWGPLSFTPRDVVLMILATLTLIAVATMLQRTRIGKALRAVSDNKDLAESSGINVESVIMFVWILGAALAAFGGVLAGLDESVEFLLGFRLLLLMFAGVILGGLGTAYGAMLGSLVVGLVVEWSTLFFSAQIKIVWALVVLIAILLFRPQGLLGLKERIG